MRIRRSSLLFAVTAISLAVTACSSSSSPTGAGSATPSSGSTDRQLVIGLAVQSTARSFFTGLVEGAREQAAKEGVTLQVVDAQDKSAKQDADISDLITAQVDGIILSPVDSTVAESLAKRAIAAKIPVLAVANQIGGVKQYGPQYVFPGTVGLVTNDDIDMGKKAAQFTAGLAKNGDPLKIANLLGTTGAANTVLRERGFIEGMKASAVPYKIVASQSGEFTNVKGEAVCQNFLQAFPAGQLDVIFSQSDEMSAGCARALRSAGREKDVSIVSIGGNAKGIALLREGLMIGTVCQKPATMGATAVTTMLASLRGDSPNAGVVFYETPVVTKDALSTCDPQW